MRKKVGAFDVSSLIVPGAVVIGGYFLLKNVGLFGGGDSGSNNALSEAALAAAVSKDLATAKAAGVGQTVTDTQLSSIADNVYSMGIASPADLDNITYQVIQVNTKTDLLRLIQIFGMRKASASIFSTCGFFNFNCPSYDLGSFLRAVLDASHIQTINGFMGSQGIDYTF